MVFGLSLPERTVRSAAALVSGAAGESVALLVPRSFQDSKSYRVFVQQMLDMLSHDVGGVKKATAAADELTKIEVAENYVAKKTIGTFHRLGRNVDDARVTADRVGDRERCGSWIDLLFERTRN